MTPNEFLSCMSTSQVCALARLPYELLCPINGNNVNNDLIRLFFEFFSGRRTWESTILEAIESQDHIKVLSLAIESKKYAAIIKHEVFEKIFSIWLQFIKSIKERQEHLIESLRDTTVRDDTISEWKNELYQKAKSIIISAELDLNETSLKEIILKDNELAVIQDEMTKFLELVEVHNAQENINYYKVAEKAIKRFTDLLRSGGLHPVCKEIAIFKSLPDLIIKRQVEFLEKIADPNESLENLVFEGFSEKIKFPNPSPQRLLRKVYLSSYGDAEESKEISLSAFSLTVFNNAPSPNKSLSTIEDIENFRDYLSTTTSMLDKANEWLGVAKASQTSEIRNLSLGEGLLSYAYNQLNVMRFDHARKLLIDSLKCLISGPRYNESSIEKAVIATMMAYIWPQFIGSQRYGEGIVEWIDNPSLLFKLLRSGKYLNTVARIWADEIDEEKVAEKFIEVVCANLGDDRTLFRFCTERIITPFNLAKRTERLVRGIKWLIRDADPPQKLLTELERLSEEIEPDGNGLLQITQSPSIKQKIVDITTFLGDLSQTGVAPVKEIIERLTKCYNVISNKDSRAQSSEPEITIKKLVNIFYPEERKYEIDLPVMVKNSENSAPANDVVLFLRNDGDRVNYSPEITKATIDLGDILPGQQKEAVFLLNLPENITSTQTELRFRVEIRIDDKVKAQRFSIKIQTSTRTHKASPYITGLAVSGTSFFGREQEIQRLKSLLCGDNPNIAALVFGIRRIGKTSILKQIMQDYDVIRRYYIIFWDVEDRPLTDTSCNFLFELCDKVKSSLPESYKIQISLSKKTFQENPYACFDTFFSALNQLGPPKRILLLIDEFDKLLFISKESENRQKEAVSPLGPCQSFQPEVFASLRKALMTCHCLNMIIAGMPSIMDQKYENRIFGLLEPVHIKAFNKKEAEQIVLSGRNVMDFSPEARDLVYDASGLQPYLMQVLCNELFHKMKFSGRDLVAPFDVDEIIEEKILPNERYFADYQSLVGDARELLYGLAKVHKRSRRGYTSYVSLSEIIQELEKSGIDYDYVSAKEVIRSLLIDSKEVGTRFRPLIEQAPNNPKKFRLVIGLLGEHLIRKGIHQEG